MSFRAVTDYLKCCDRKFDQLGDAPILISRDTPGKIFAETYKEVTQWQ